MKHLLSALLFPLFFLQTSVTAEELEVPALVALTGHASSFGIEELNSYTLALEEWNARGGVDGKKVKLRVEDTNSSSVGTISALRHLTSSGAKVILGPTWADTFQGVVPIAVKSELLLLTPSAEGRAIDQKANLGPSLITLYPSTEVEVKTLVEAASERGAKRVGMVTEEEPFALFLKKVLEESDLRERLVVNQTVLGGVSDFRSIITAIKRKSVDSLFVFVFTEASVISLLRQINELGGGLKLYGIHDVSSYINRAEFSPYLKKMVYVDFKIRDQEFARRYRDRFGHDPYLTALYAYDTINLLLRALSSGKRTAEEIRRFLLDSEHETISYGVIRFLPEGRLDQAEVHVLEVQ